MSNILKVSLTERLCLKLKLLNKKKLTFVFISFFIISSFIGKVVGSSLPEPGSKEDPLVTKSYVDNYIAQQITPLKNAVYNLSIQVAQLQATVDELVDNLKPTIILTLNSQNAYIGEQLNILDAAPFLANGRTMVPFRFIGEALGAEVNWEPSTQKVSYILGDKKIEFSIGANSVLVNGQEEKLEVPASILNGRTFVPVRMVSEMLGAKVDWNPNTKEVIIIP